MKLASLLILGAAVMFAAGCSVGQSPTPASPTAMASSNLMTTTIAPVTDAKSKTDEDWRKQLTAQQYRVLREKGTERPYTGKYYKNHDKGLYRCAGCGAELFLSDTKFDSGCGWPSFYAPMATNAVIETADNSHLMERTEVTCSKCGGHLGHVFEDGPKPTGLRYCINSASLTFEPQEAKPGDPLNK